MPRNYSFYVYILANSAHTVFYTGVTNNLDKRIWQHKRKESKFTSKYNCDILLYHEHFTYIQNAIAREKQLKKWKREWKIQLIKTMNPDMTDLAKDWYKDAL